MNWEIKLITVLITIACLFGWHRYEIHKSVNIAVTEQANIYQKRIDELTIKSLKVESDLKTKVSSIQGEKDAQIKDIDRKYRTTIDSLRQRQERSTASNSTGNSSNAESTKGATGAELYREDASFLAGFARDTEELKVQLNACYLQYDNVREQLNNYRK